MLRFIAWVAGMTFVGALLSGLNVLIVSACAIVGAIGGATHTIMRFIEDREKHEAFLQRTRDGLTADHRESK